MATKWEITFCEAWRETRPTGIKMAPINKNVAITCKKES